VNRSRSRAPRAGAATATPLRADQTIAGQQQEFVFHFLDTVLGTAEKRQAARRSTSASSSNGTKRASQAASARKK